MPIFSGEYPTKSTLDDEDRVLISDSVSAGAIKGGKISTFIQKVINNTRAVAGWIKGSMLEDSTVTYGKLDHDSFSKITARLASDQSVSAGVLTRVNLSSAVSVGEGLTLSGGAVIVGEGISHVQVSGAAYYFEGLAGGLRTAHAYTRVNGSEVNRSTSRLSENYSTNEISSVIVEVTEGDVIDLAVNVTGVNYTLGTTRSLLTVIAL